MPVRRFISSSPVADCTLARKLIKGRDTESLLVDNVYATNALVAALEQAGEKSVIPSRKRGKNLRSYGKYLYRLWNLIKTAFQGLKRRRGVATICEKHGFISGGCAYQVHRNWD